MATSGTRRHVRSLFGVGAVRTYAITSLRIDWVRDGHSFMPSTLAISQPTTPPNRTSSPMCRPGPEPGTTKLRNPRNLGT